MRIDTHQHFWIYSPRDYVWMGPEMESLKRDYQPTDLAPQLESAGIHRTIAVQARQTIEETRWLLELADDFPFISGVVGWVDLRSPRVHDDLEDLWRHPKLRGVRHVVQDEPDDGFMLRKDFLRGIENLAEFGLTYDLLLFSRHLPVACDLVKQFPAQRFVLDHISKPLIKDHKLEPWATELRRLAAFPNVMCKISGLVTEADWRHWKPAEFTPYLDVVFGCFGANRLMVGSDWPVCTLAANYGDVIEIASDYLGKLSADEQAAVWFENPKRFYGLDVEC